MGVVDSYVSKRIKEDDLEKQNKHALEIKEIQTQNAVFKEKLKQDLAELQSSSLNWKKLMTKHQADAGRYKDLLITQRNMFGDFLTDMQTGKWYKKGQTAIDLPKWYEAKKSRFGNIKGATIKKVNNKKQDCEIKYYSDITNKWVSGDFRWCALNHANLERKKRELSAQIEKEIHGNHDPSQPTTFVN